MSGTQLPGNVGRQLSMELSALDDDRIFNASVVVALMAEELFDPQKVDLMSSKALKARRVIALGFLKDVLDETVLTDDPLALRSDFVLTYEALCQWMSEEPGLELGREIISKLQTPLEQQNGMPSPPQTEKRDQLEYIFEEWIRLQRKDTSERSYVAFVRQLHDQGVVYRRIGAGRRSGCGADVARAARFGDQAARTSWQLRRG